MSRQHWLLALLAAASGAIAGGTSLPALAQGAQRALFDTRAEAEAAARHFNCQGAHRMGNHWMPCARHGSPASQHAKPTTP